jgi:predicted deacylase
LTTASASLPAFAVPVPELSRWRRGNVGVEGVWRFDGKHRGRHVLITALIHGNELCGAWALVDLLQALQSQSLSVERGSLTLAFANLEAFDRFDRHHHDASRFVDRDMNRVWGESLVATAATSSEHRRAQTLRPFVEQADWLLDLHSMHEIGPPLLLTGPHARNIALARELACTRDVIVDAGHAEGVRMRDHGRFGLGDDQLAETASTRSLLIECGWHGDPASVDVAHNTCARFLQASDVLSNPQALQAWRQPDAVPRVVEVTHAVVAPGNDTQFANDWACMQRVPLAGTVLGWHGDAPFVTPYDDCTLVMPSLRQLNKGVTVMRIAHALQSSPLRPPVAVTR